LKLGKGIITKARKKSGIVENLLDFFLSGKNPEIHKTALLKLGKCRMFGFLHNM
jgi:hypothetical protein